MSDKNYSYFDTGIYSLSDASRLTKVSRGRIRRWLRGYEFISTDDIHKQPPIWQGQLPPINDTLALGFLDLTEIRFIDAFIRRGVTWKTLRKAVKKAQTLFETYHPFCTHKFKTNGREIFVELIGESGDTALMNLMNDQQLFHEIIDQYLVNIEFDSCDSPTRWWPIGTDHEVVIDPRRSFGKPIVNQEGVPTSILATAYGANGSMDAVADWYQVSVNAVSDAIQFEENIAA